MLALLVAISIHAEPDAIPVEVGVVEFNEFCGRTKQVWCWSAHWQDTPEFRQYRPHHGIVRINNGYVIVQEWPLVVYDADEGVYLTRLDRGGCEFEVRAEWFVESTTPEYDPEIRARRDGWLQNDVFGGGR